MQSFTTYRVEGLNIERQLNKLVMSGANVKHVRRQGKKVLILSVPYSQMNMFVDFFDEKCYNIQIVKTDGLMRFVNFFKHRVALFVCGVICVCCLCIASGFVWRVEVGCEENIDKQKIVETLQNSGFWVGMQKGNIELDKAENLLCNSVPNVKYAVVSVKGSTLFVKVFQKEVPQDIVDLSKPNSLYAKNDGVIARLLVVSGTAKVKVGDVVKKGQVLIEGKRTFSDGTTEDTCAVGEIFATVSEVGTKQYTGIKKVLTKTENMIKSFSLRLFKFAYGRGTEKIFEHQIVETSERTLFPLPIKIRTTVIYEAIESDVKLIFEAEREKLKHDALGDALAKLGNTVFTNIVYSEMKNDLGILVSAEVFAQIRIDTY